MKASKYNLLPLVLIGCGLLSLVGCVYVPYFGSPSAQGSRPNDEVELLGGAATSKIYQGQYLHKFRIRVSTRADVLQELPSREFASDDQQSLRYYQQRTKGYLVYPLCFFLGGDPDVETYYVELRFDKRGLLWSSERTTVSNLQ